MTPDDDSPYEKGLKALNAEEFGSAREWFTKAIAADPDAWEPRYARAFTLLNIKDLADDKTTLAAAAEDLDKALEINGAASDVVALRGHVAALSEQHEQAVGLFLTAAGRSRQRKLVEAGLTDSLNELLAAVEVSDQNAAEDLALCDRLENMVAVAQLPTIVRDELTAEILATRAYRRQKTGDEEGALADLRHLARLVPGHPRLPMDLPTASTGARNSNSPLAAADELTFESVGGADGANSFVPELRKIFDIYLGDRDIQATRSRLAELGQPATRSILLFGPSGCGKTYVVRAFAGEYRRRHGRELPLFRLRVEEILGRWVGTSERRLADYFDQAIDAQPSILFCDEIDSIGMTREGSQDWRQEFTALFLQQVDRLREEGAALIFFGCTNRVWSVDLALLRRFDRLIPVELPDEEARRDIFQVHLERITKRFRAEHIDLDVPARKSLGLTPGDIQKVVSRATDDLLGVTGPDAPVLTQAHLLSALDHYRQPMHVREWVRQSLAALNAIGQTDMAEDLERMYGPYIGGIASLTSNGSHPQRAAIPLEAWTEEPEFDLTALRRLMGPS
jgi:tetratricopeptide (TPR) repeat protein